MRKYICVAVSGFKLCFSSGNADIERISDSSSGLEVNNSSISPVICGNGRYIAFLSLASNLVENYTNDSHVWGGRDAFVLDRVTGITKRINDSTSGEQADRGAIYGLAIREDGLIIAFISVEPNLAENDGNFIDDIFVHNLLLTGTTKSVSNCRLDLE